MDGGDLLQEIEIRRRKELCPPPRVCSRDIGKHINVVGRILELQDLARRQTYPDARDTHREIGELFWSMGYECPVPTAEFLGIQFN